MELQEKITFYENSYNEITQKFKNTHFSKLEKLYNLHFPQEISEISQKKTENSLEKSNISVKEEEKLSIFQDILRKKPKGKPEIVGNSKTTNK